MTTPLNTPGVYTQEISNALNSVTEVQTAVPVFIGYTQHAYYNGQSYLNKPFLISSMAEFLVIFGGAPNPDFALNATTTTVYDLMLNNTKYQVKPAGPLYYLYNSLQLFFLNGGGSAYIISVGDYSEAPAYSGFATALALAGKIGDATMILAPDALHLGNDYYKLMNEAIAQCTNGGNMITLVDVVGGDCSDLIAFQLQRATGNDPVSQLRTQITQTTGGYGTAYFPWLNTSVVTQDTITFQNLSGGFAPYMESPDMPNYEAISQLVSQIKPGLSPQQLQQIHEGLWNLSANYRQLMSCLLEKTNCLPVTPALAGVMNMVDTSQGVWEAPANVALMGVTSPTLLIGDTLQGWLNVDAASGKSVNAIRLFQGQGVMVWGARTLDGNSQDWCYVNVRRTMIMIEQSIKAILQQYAFAANDSMTWSAVQSEVSALLSNVWSQGGLQGAKASDAFSVMIGLGTTMTAQDILNGYMVLSAMVAVTHPAEFLVINLMQQMAAAS